VNIFKRRRYGLAPSEAYAFKEMSPEMVRFLDFVMNAALVMLTAWSVLFYLSVCLPSARKLHLALSISFLFIPLFFFELATFQHQVEARRWSEAQLGRLGWVLIRWVRGYMSFVLEMLVVFSVGFLILRLLMKFFIWPQSLFGWITMRVDSFLGVSVAVLSSGVSTGWIASWAYVIIGGFYLFNFLYLLYGLVTVAMLGAMADSQFVDEKILSPFLYGRFARLLWGSFILAVGLSLGGALYKIYSGIGSLFGWSVLHVDLDWLTRVFTSTQFMGLSPPPWWTALHVPLAMTIVRVLLPRLPYAKNFLSATFGSPFYTIGSVVLVLPLFFQIAVNSLPVGNFYDGYLLGAQCVYAVVYVMFLIPVFVLIIADRIKAESKYNPHRFRTTQN
jgi:hypothetical protein